MTPTNVIEIAPTPASPMVQAMRHELGVLHEINGILKEAPIRAHQWPKAEMLLNYLGAKIDALQAVADAQEAKEGVAEQVAG